MSGFVASFFPHRRFNLSLSAPSWIINA